MKIIEGQQWFKPMEIAELGLIQSSKGKRGTVAGNYNYVLKLIKSGRLGAKNYSAVEGKPYWLVPEDEIKRYHATPTRVK